MKMLKNRISAKKCREKKKKEHVTIENENTALKIELANLRKDLIFIDMFDKLKYVKLTFNLTRLKTEQAMKKWEVQSIERFKSIFKQTSF